MLILKTIKIYAIIRTNVPFLYVKITNIYTIIEEMKLIPNFYNDLFDSLIYEMIQVKCFDQTLRLFKINLFFLIQRMCIFDNSIEYVEKSLEFYLAKVFQKKSLFLILTKKFEKKNQFFSEQNFIKQFLDLVDITLRLFLSSDCNISATISNLEHLFKKIFSFKNDDEKSLIVCNLGIYFFSYLKKLFVTRNYETKVRCELLNMALKIANYQYKALCVRFFNEDLYFYN